MMDSKPFGKPVVVEPGQVGRFCHIRNAWEAAECLMTVWPPNRCPRHGYAVETCLKVLEGGRSTAKARRARIEVPRGPDVFASDDRLY